MISTSSRHRFLDSSRHANLISIFIIWDPDGMLIFYNLQLHELKRVSKEHGNIDNFCLYVIGN